MFRSVLTICTGNICRSPMAEGILYKALEPKGVRVESAGIAALVGRPADEAAIALLRADGIDISGHRARQLTSGLAKDFELILVMEAVQQKQVESMVPSARGKVRRLGTWGDFDVPDPFRQSRERFEFTKDLIERGITDLLKKMWGISR